MVVNYIRYKFMQIDFRLTTRERILETERPANHFGKTQKWLFYPMRANNRLEIDWIFTKNQFIFSANIKVTVHTNK